MWSSDVHLTALLQTGTFSASAFVWGLVVGIGTSGLTWVLRHAIGRFLSALHALASRGRSNVSGRWTAVYTKEISDESGNVVTEVAETATLRQFWHWVWGEIEEQQANPPRRRYGVQGTMRGEVLVATYEGKDTPALDRGAFVLVVPLTSKSMSGHYSWVAGNETKSGSYEWKKEP